MQNGCDEPKTHKQNIILQIAVISKIPWYKFLTISVNMDWGQHISEISSKATKTLGFLCRNLAFAPKSTKEVAYKNLIQPKIEYAAPNWSLFFLYYWLCSNLSIMPGSAIFEILIKIKYKNNNKKNFLAESLFK